MSLMLQKSETSEAFLARKQTIERVLILGVGNPDRGDDAVGCLAAELLARRLQESFGVGAAMELGIEIKAAATDPALLMESWRAKEFVVIFDAVVLENSHVGQVHTFLAHEKPLPSLSSFASSHILGLADAIELARVFGELPPSIRIVGIQAQCFNHGAALSAAVSKGMEQAVEEVFQELLKFLKWPRKDFRAAGGANISSADT